MSPGHQLLEESCYFIRTDMGMGEGAGEEGRKKKGRARKRQDSSDEREQYLAAALRFEPPEYFRHLASYATVRVYLRLLEMYAENPANVNYYIFVFLQVPPFTPQLPRGRCDRLTA